MIMIFTINLTIFLSSSLLTFLVSFILHLIGILYCTLYNCTASYFILPLQHNNFPQEKQAAILFNTDWFCFLAQVLKYSFHKQCPCDSSELNVQFSSRYNFWLRTVPLNMFYKAKSVNFSSVNSLMVQNFSHQSQLGEL